LKFVIASLVGIIFFSLVVSAMGEIEYKTKEPRFSRSPLVCIYEPIEPLARESIRNEWVKKTEDGIKSWQYALMEGEEKNRDKWRIDIIKISPDKQEEFDNEFCTVEIKFTDTHHPRHPGWVGWETFDGQRSQITIFYMDKEICGYEYDEEIEENKPYFCYVDEFKRSGQIGNIAAHEFGHSMGLGHYVSTSSRENYNWSFHPESSPSIMTNAIHYNEELNEIKQLDVDKVKEHYQNRGFGKYIPIPDDVSNDFQKPEIEAAITKIESTNRSPIMIEGVIPEQLILRGTPVEIQIKFPDGTVETGAVISTSSGFFEYPFSFDSKLDLGTYEILIKYNDKVIEYKIIEIVESESTVMVKSSVIPEWVKNNARWWSEGKISEQTFLNTLEYLVNEKIINIPKQFESSLDVENEKHIPSWIKNNAGWWATDKISEEEFLKGIQYLIDNEFILVKLESSEN
jgi:hypothetical protein